MMKNENVRPSLWNSHARNNQESFDAKKITSKDDKDKFYYES